MAKHYRTTTLDPYAIEIAVTYDGPVKPVDRRVREKRGKTREIVVPRFYIYEVFSVRTMRLDADKRDGRRQLILNGWLSF